MTLTVSALEKMVEFGLTSEQILAIAREMEAPRQERSKNAERQARFRARKADTVTESVTSNVTDNVTAGYVSGVPGKEVPPTPPSRKLTLVTPPIVPPVGGDLLEGKTDEKPVASTDLKILIDRVWQVMSAAARRRTSRGDIEAALRSAMKRGQDPALIVLGLETYYRSPDATKNDGQFAKGAHRMIQNDRWAAFAADLEPAKTEGQQADDREAWWGRRVADYVKSRHWNEVDWGPRPGRDGCHVPSQILESHGFLDRKAV